MQVLLQRMMCSRKRGAYQSDTRIVSGTTLGCDDNRAIADALIAEERTVEEEPWPVFGAYMD